MIFKRLVFYFFGDVGPYDSFNPAYVLNQQYVPEILYLIASNNPFSISKYDISKSLNIDDITLTTIINSLELIDSIEIKEDYYRIKFPVFLEEDVIRMDKKFNNIGEKLGDRIISLKDIIYESIADLKCLNNYSIERILYHIICDDVFDGYAFDYFSDKNIMCTSKINPGNRDYIIVAYEDSLLVEKHSNKLLCSSNNYNSSRVTFNSFGDSNGLRKDLFRYFKLIQNNISTNPFNELNVIYNNILDELNNEISMKCEQLIFKIIFHDIKYSQLTDKEIKLVKFLKQLNYIEIDERDIHIIVPIFYENERETIIKSISNLILNNIYAIVKEAFEDFDGDIYEFTPMKHGVNIKETANELWHQIFGFTNEYLVKTSFIESPPNIEGEGRYFRRLIIKEK